MCLVPYIYRFLLRGLVESGYCVLPVQLLDYTVAHNIPVSNTGKPMEMDAVGLLYRCDQLVGYICH